MGKQEDHETALLQRFAIFETVKGGGENSNIIWFKGQMGLS